MVSVSSNSKKYFVEDPKEKEIQQSFKQSLKKIEQNPGLYLRVKWFGKGVTTTSYYFRSSMARIQQEFQKIGAVKDDQLTTRYEAYKKKLAPMASKTAFNFKISSFFYSIFSREKVPYARADQSLHEEELKDFSRSRRSSSLDSTFSQGSTLSTVSIDSNSTVDEGFLPQQGGGREEESGKVSNTTLAVSEPLPEAPKEDALLKSRVSDLKTKLLPQGHRSFGQYYRSVNKQIAQEERRYNQRRTDIESEIKDREIVLNKATSNIQFLKKEIEEAQKDASEEEEKLNKEQKAFKSSNEKYKNYLEKDLEKLKKERREIITVIKEMELQQQKESENEDVFSTLNEMKDDFLGFFKNNTVELKADANSIEKEFEKLKKNKLEIKEKIKEMNTHEESTQNSLRLITEQNSEKKNRYNLLVDELKYEERISEKTSKELMDLRGEMTQLNNNCDKKIEKITRGIKFIILKLEKIIERGKDESAENYLKRLDEMMK